MLTIIIPENTLWDENTQTFIYTKETKLILEHSLVSLSKWEAHYEVSFLLTNSKNELYGEKLIYYIQCMTITQNVDPTIYYALTKENMDEIIAYINKKMTATVITDRTPQPARSSSFITAEIIYYDMIELGIPIKFEKWHLNRLMTLIRVCSIKKSPPKNMSRTEAARYNNALNAKRLKRKG